MPSSLNHSRVALHSNRWSFQHRECSSLSLPQTFRFDLISLILFPSSELSLYHDCGLNRCCRLEKNFAQICHVCYHHLFIRRIATAPLSECWRNESYELNFFVSEYIDVCVCVRVILRIRVRTRFSVSITYTSVKFFWHWFLTLLSYSISSLQRSDGR